MSGLFENDVLGTSSIQTYCQNYTGYTGYTGYSGYSSYLDPEYQEELHDNKTYSNSIYNGDQTEASALDYAVIDFVSYIEDGEEDHALEAYNDLLEELKKQSNFQGLIGEDGDESRLKTTARSLLESYLSGRDGGQVDLEQWFEDETQNIKERDRQKGFTFRESRVDETTTEDLIEAVLGKKVDRNETTIVGHVWNAVSGFIPSLWRGIFGDKANY